MFRRIKKQIIQALSSGNKSIYELMASQDASISEFFYVLKEMKDEGIISIKKGIVSLLNDRPNRYVGVQYEGKCRVCDGTGYSIHGYERILEKFKDIIKNRPNCIEEYDQGAMSVEDVVRRVAFIHERGDLLDASILVMGDDDLFSIAASLTELPKEVFVLDVDDRIISFLKNVADERGLPIKAMKYDVRDPIPYELKNKFDVFITDPVETLPGIGLFLSRAVSALNGMGSSGYFGLTTHEATRKKWYEIQKILHNMGFVITDIRRRFSIYPQEGKLFFDFSKIIEDIVPLDTEWYSSSFLRIEAIKEPKPIYDGRVDIGNELYEDEESSIPDIRL
ncbi:putative methyltransferase [Methanosarcinales archaeon]|nr:MAG: putative methyltransferase [Methanosarcinales archaeon]